MLEQLKKEKELFEKVIAVLSGHGEKSLVRAMEEKLERTAKLYNAITGGKNEKKNR